MQELCNTKNAAPVGKNTGTFEIYWITLEEWSNVIYSWASNSGMTNSVLTFFELLNDHPDQEFHQLNEQVFMKALKHLETKGKCEVMEIDGSYGVKFFWIKCGIMLQRWEFRKVLVSGAAADSLVSTFCRSGWKFQHKNCLIFQFTQFILSILIHTWFSHFVC